jgi:hypothetical protein
MVDWREIFDAAQAKKRHKADAYGDFLVKRGAKIAVKTPCIACEYRFLHRLPVLAVQAAELDRLGNVRGLYNLRGVKVRNGSGQF